MPLTSSDLGALVGNREAPVQVTPHISTSRSLQRPDGVDAVLNATGQTMQMGDVPHCRVNISGGETAMGRALGFLTECERLGLRVIVCGTDADKIVEAFRHREIIR